MGSSENRVRLNPLFIHHFPICLLLHGHEKLSFFRQIQFSHYERGPKGNIILFPITIFSIIFPIHHMFPSYFPSYDSQRAHPKSLEPQVAPSNPTPTKESHHISPACSNGERISPKTAANWISPRLLAHCCCSGGTKSSPEMENHHSSWVNQL